MLKRYRRHFVAANMMLVGAVLLAAFVVLGVLSYRNNFEQMEQTMRMALRPWNEPSNEFRLIGERPDKREDMEPPAGKPEDERRQQEDQEAFLTVFYNNTTGEVSLLSDEPEESENVREAAQRVFEESEPFGTLKEYGYFYYKEATAAGCKIVLVQRSYLTGRVAAQILLMTPVFLALLVLFFFISLWLARRAARPMENAIAMERRFVADISHDLKTPITVILANNSILKSSAASTVGEQMQWVDSTDEAARNMQGLVNEMLTLSSLESPERTVNKETVSFSAAAEKCALQLESLAYERGVSIESDVEENINVPATQEYLERICGGLIENALKYEPVGGKVRVRLASARHKAVFTVQNGGSVIPAEDLPHIFERFYRADKARQTQQGHGLGLPIVKQMVDLLGGQITVRSTEAEGTVFSVTFEIAE